MQSKGRQSLASHTGDRAWHALYTRHQHEKTVAHILSQKRFEILLPLYAAAHQWKDRVKELSLPLFPCYVFIRGGRDRWHEVITTPGIYEFVGIKGNPSVIPEDEIEAVRRVIERRLRVEPHPFLNCGDWVRIKSGPMEGMEGILIRKKSSFRLVLSVQLLQKSVAVELDASIAERQIRRNVPIPLQSAPGHFPARFGARSSWSDMVWR